MILSKLILPALVENLLWRCWSGVVGGVDGSIDLEFADESRGELLIATGLGLLFKGAASSICNGRRVWPRFVGRRVFSGHFWGSHDCNVEVDSSIVIILSRQKWISHRVGGTTLRKQDLHRCQVNRQEIRKERGVESYRSRDVLAHFLVHVGC